MKARTKLAEAAHRASVVFESEPSWLYGHKENYRPTEGELALGLLMGVGEVVSRERGSEYQSGRLFVNSTQWGEEPADDDSVHLLLELGSLEWSEAVELVEQFGRQAR